MAGSHEGITFKQSLLMKTKKPSFVLRLFVLGLLWFAASAFASPEDQPAITSIHLDGTNVVVTAQVPAGIHRVTLECRSRLGSGAWEPRAVTRLDGSGGEITFRVPKAASLEMLRVRADTTEPLPASFYAGTNSFAGQPVSSGGLGAVFDAAPTGAPGGGPSAGSPSRDVVESDIWKIDGDTLYFFNQFRGLQVIDISDPDHAAVKGTLPLPAAGEQMYVRDTNHVVLLARNGCGWWGNGAESQALVVRIDSGKPNVVASLPISGDIQESRLVGTALYVASDTYRPTPTNSWEWGTLVSSFDLSDPETPVAKDTLWYSGSGHVVSATDRFFFVVTSDPANWTYHSIVQSIDISAPDGSLKPLASIRPAGMVADKFKLNVNGDVLSVISASWNDTRRWITTLETFSLVNPMTPVKLGSLKLAEGDQLHATRFDGNLAYIVTFFRIDPLWVVDISDPTRPRIAGELQVPGWSTFIQPLGDRLVTVGIDNTNSWRVSVSLFDVHDPSAPALVSKVALGQNYSWSEANTDEKAFNVMPDEHLILLPYQGYLTNGYAQRMQLIDLDHDSLALRGVIDHQTQPRRAAVHNDRIVSISGEELLSVDATDRDHPQINADLPLAWSVDQLFLRGQHLIELSTGNSWWWGNQPNAAIRIAPAGEPDNVLNEIDLANGLPILGAAVRDGRLYLAQGQPDFWPIIYTGGGTNQPPPTNPPPTLFVSIYDVSNLPEVKLLGETDAAIPPLGWGASFQVVWPKAGVLVLSGGGGGYWDPWIDFGLARPAGPVGIDSPAGGALWAPIYWGGNGGRLIAFDVSSATSPTFLSDVNLATNSWWSFSTAFTSGSSVFLSHQSYIHPPPIIIYDDAAGKWSTNNAPDWAWVQRWYLDVVDYADPKDPTVRKPVNIPGTLNGVSRDGELLYTVGPHWKMDTNWWYDGSEYLDASAYDGVEVHLVDSLALSRYWPHPVLAEGDAVFLGHPSETNTAPNLLEAWTLSGTGKFTQLSKTELSGAAQNLANFGNLFAAQINNQVSLLDVTSPGAPLFLVTGGPPGCVWFDLTKADGALDRGLWLPLGTYGVSEVEVKKAPSP